ncbi:MAG: protein phosphatase 2C domain-containing protein [Planctomycetota bacterium]|nr:protein phosphatase 2C domain-containing protein [Planctomycetota bacterium]
MAALTHKGLVRDNNEDSLYYDVRDRVTVICDGMGGHAGGQVASEIAVQVVSGSLRTLRPQDWLDEERVIDTLKHAIFGANDHILSRARVDHSLFDMGTTIVACCFMQDRVVTANIGDSRIYRIAEGEIEQVSDDHSLVAERIRAGVLEAGSPEARMLSNILTRALGMEQITVDITVEDLRPGDLYLLCTDGLSDLIEPFEMCEVALHNDDLQLACMELVDLANSRGGHDNITVALIRAL